MENVEPTQFYENYWKFNDTSNNDSVKGKGEENPGIYDKIDKVYAELEYTATLPLIVMNSDMRLFFLLFFYFFLKKNGHFIIFSEKPIILHNIIYFWTIPATRPMLFQE